MAGEHRSAKHRAHRDSILEQGTAPIIACKLNGKLLHSHRFIDLISIKSIALATVSMQG
jgi:hypothetical protein